MSSLRRLRRLQHLPSKFTFCGPFTSLRLQPHSSFSSFSSKEPPFPSETTANVTLTEEYFAKINHLIPRLCDGNQLTTAVRLTTTALLTNPPLESLSFSVLIDSLSSQPDMTHAMSLLTHLKHTPFSHTYVRPITLMLINSYFENHKCKHALKVFNWMERPDSPCSPDENIYGIFINGFCKKGFVFEALKVLRAMVGANLIPNCDSKEWIYRGLLREARVQEAMELKGALNCEGDEGMKRVLVLLEYMIVNWTD